MLWFAHKILLHIFQCLLKGDKLTKKYKKFHIPIAETVLYRLQQLKICFLTCSRAKYALLCILFVSVFIQRGVYAVFNDRPSPTFYWCAKSQ